MAIDDALNPAAFYDALAGDYDRMTGDNHRFRECLEHYRPIVEVMPARRVLDAGCGTGSEALTLASLGCEVIGVDASSAFIEAARNKAASRAVAARFEQGDLRDLSNLQDSWANLTVCRGNTLPHITAVADLRRALMAFARVTRPGGILILGWLNYIPIMKERRRLIGVTGDNQSSFIRFYDFLADGSIAFNILRLEQMGGKGQKQKWQTNWQTTILTPWSADDVGMLLMQTGWEELEIASDLARAEFSPEESKDVVIFAVRKE